MIKLKTLLLEVIEMSSQQAEDIFKKYGIPNASHLSKVQLKSIYRHLAIKYHPDRGGKNMDMRNINLAYEVLLKNAPSMSSTYGGGVRQTPYSSTTQRPHTGYARPPYSGPVIIPNRSKTFQRSLLRPLNIWA